MKNKLLNFLFEEEAIEEVMALAGSGVVAYTAPIGAPGIGSSSKLEKGFWRKRAGKKVKTSSPKVHNPDALALKEMQENLFEFEAATDRGMARLWADQPDVDSPEQPVKSASLETE